MRPSGTLATLTARRLTLTPVAPQQTSRTTVRIRVASLILGTRLIGVLFPDHLVVQAVTVEKLKRPHSIVASVPPRQPVGVRRIGPARGGNPVLHLLHHVVDESVV